MVHLTTALDAASGVPLYEQLYRSLAAEMRTGAISAGTRMPGKRRLAAELSVSVNTVDAAYQMLAAEGYLEARERSGFYVQEYLALPERTESAAPPQPEAAPAPEQPVRYDLSTRGVDPELFPFRTWARLQKELLYSSPQLLTHGDAQGDPALRQALAEYLSEYRGVQCGPHQIVVGAGTEYLYSLLVQLLAPRSTYCLEDPGYKKIAQVYKRCGVTCRYGRLDDQGITVDSLKRSGADIAHISPNHHFPTGITMPASRRYEVLAWANEKEGRYLIEELQGQKGYYNDPAYSVEFEIKSDRVWQVVGNATNDMDEYIVTEKYCNHETLGQLTIRKLGNVLTDYQDGQFIYTQDNLAGAVYEIHAAADIATPDRQGTYWYKSGDLVATVTTGAEGQVDEVTFSPTRTQATYDFLTVSHDGTKGEVTVTLPLGKYTITEVQAPYGFVLTQQSYTVEFGWDNQKNDIVLAKTIVSHEQDGDKKCSYSIVNVKDASDAHKNGQTLVFENARVLPTPEKPGDKVSKIGVGIYKQDREALTYLPGAVYELYTVDDIYSADGTKLLEAGTKLATSSTTNASGFTWFDVDIPIRAKTYPDSGNSGRYRIVEITAPAGYLLDSTPMEVAFTYEGQQIAWQVVDGTNTNLRTTVVISKQDITNGKELPDAKLEIRDADGNLVEGWTSTKTPHTVRGLELEKAYTLTETRAPDGYAEAESIVFKLVQNGTEQVNEVYVKSDDDWVKLNDATVIMQDAPVLDIDKTDIAGNLLPGATLTIRDANDEVVDTWTTDYKTHSVPISDDFLKLSGEAKEYIYTLTEDAAPAGFEIAESVQFKVQQADENVCLFVRENADAEWVRADKRLIQMIDEATPREDTPTPTPAPTPQPTPAATPAPTPAPTPHKVQTLPQTGDGFPLLAIVVVSLASATGIVLLTVRQKNALKETSDEENTDESADR